MNVDCGIVYEGTKLVFASFSAKRSWQSDFVGDFVDDFVWFLRSLRFITV